VIEQILTAINATAREKRDLDFEEGDTIRKPAVALTGWATDEVLVTVR
jgi:hypothetical protein